MARLRWFKGNLHTHPIRTGAVDDSERVVAWYREHGYDFVALTEHDRTFVYQGDRRFKTPLVLQGEEVTIRTINNRPSELHLNGIGISRVVDPIDAIELVPTLQANIDAILDAGGIAMVNHPNTVWLPFHGWTENAQALSQTKGASLLEVYNGSQRIVLYGTAEMSSKELIWDQVLSSGLVIYGAATDDAAEFVHFSSDFANPGRGWVMVRAQRLEQKAILNALAAGEFYSSTGVTLSHIQLTKESIELGIQEVPGVIHTTAFTGHGGQVLDQQMGLEARYDIRGDEKYVRATVRASSEQKAWIQPVFLPDS